MSEIVPLSLNEYVAQYGGDLASFGIYCLGYWLQQNANKAGESYYERLRGQYEQS